VLDPASRQFRAERYHWTAPQAAASCWEGAADSGAASDGDWGAVPDYYSDSDASVGSQQHLRMPAVSLADAAAAPAISVSADCREAEFLWPHDRPRNGRYDQRFGFLTIRLVGYSDGLRAHSWCRGSQHRCDAAVGNLFSGSDRPDVPMSWGDCLPPCVAGSRMIAALGGEAQLLPRFQQLRASFFSEASESEDLIQSYSLHGRSYKIVRADGLWGLVDMAAGRCRTCPSHNAHCRHVVALAGGSGQQPGGVQPDSADAWNARFDKVFDYNTGERMLTCISRKRILEDPADSVTSLEMYTGAHCLHALQSASNHRWKISCSN